MKEDLKQELIKNAIQAAKFSYSPYSGFRVGAALKGASGKLYTGTNIENRSFGLTSCAERNALFTALGEGERDFQALAIYCPDADYPVSPCGACRQVLSEFFSPEAGIVYVDGENHIVETTMGELFPQDALHHLKKEKET